MLSEEEKRRVSAFIDTSKHDLAKDVKYASEFYVSSVLWLAEKLKETNKELEKLEYRYEQLEDTFNELHLRYAQLKGEA